MQIEIPGPLLKRLQKHAIPFLDTPVSVIEKWADFFEQHHSKVESVNAGSANARADVPSGCREFDSIHTAVSYSPQDSTQGRIRMAQQ